MPAAASRTAGSGAPLPPLAASQAVTAVKRALAAARSPAKVRLRRYRKHATYREPLRRPAADLPARSAAGVTPTAAGKVLYDEARTMLERVDQIRAQVAAAGASTLTAGTIADTAEEA